MSWNKPQIHAETYNDRKTAGSMPSVLHLLIIALFIVAIAIATWIILKDDSPEIENVKPEKQSRIKEVPHYVSTQEVAKAEQAEKPFWMLDASQTNGFSPEMIHKWRDRHSPPPAYSFKNSKKHSRWHIFDYKSENRIAALLCAKPGTAKIGRIKMDRSMTDDFIESLKHPIIPTAEDDDFTKDLKRQMNQVKIDLKERIDNGEDLGRIIEDTEDEMRKLSMFKRDLIKNLHGLIKNGNQTQEDIEIFKEAANKMLEEKGIAPLKFTDITEEKLMNIKKEDDL